MAARGSGRARRPHNVAMLVGLGLLAIPGFALGVAAGMLWEAPGLVASYLLGRTEAIAWGPDAPGSTQPAAEELPAVAAPAAPVEAAAPVGGTARTEEPPDAGSPRGRVAVQVGAFSDRAAAGRLARDLREQGFPVYVASGESGGATRWRVRVGPLATREEGERTAARLKREQRLPTWVLEEDR